MARYMFQHEYDTLREDQLVAECVAVGLPVIDVQRYGDPGESIDVVTSRDLTGPEQTTLGNTVSAHTAAGVIGYQTPTSINYLINSLFAVDARSRNNVNISDNTYGLDRWYVLTHLGPAAMIQTVNQANMSYRLTFRQMFSTAQRYGLAQVIESSMAQALRGRSATFQFRVLAGVSPGIRAAILSWTGTANSAPRDVVNDWNSTSFTPGNFYISSVTVVAQTPAPVIATDNNDNPVLINVSGIVPTTVNNLIVFLWTDTARGQASDIMFFEPGLYIGSENVSFLPPDAVMETLRCSRYCLKISGLDLGQAQQASRVFQGGVLFPVPMSRAPSLFSGTFAVNAGNPGTVALNNATATGSGFVNSAANWTSGALVSVTAILEAEL
jgi:hypothetical protein